MQELAFGADARALERARGPYRHPSYLARRNNDTEAEAEAELLQMRDDNDDSDDDDDAAAIIVGWSACLPASRIGLHKREGPCTANKPGEATGTIASDYQA